MNSPHWYKRLFRVLVYSLLGLVLLFGGIFLFSPRVDYGNPERLKVFGTRPFDRDNWLKATPGARATMIYDLARTRPFLKLDSNQIVALLGPPTATYGKGNHIAYRVGDRFTFALIWNPRSHAYDSFWIEPFPEEILYLPRSAPRREGP